MNFVFILILLVLTFVVIFLYAKLDEKIKKISGKGFVEDIRKEIEGLIIEFNKVSNKKIIVMDEKIKELDKLIKLADEKIIKLDTMTRSYTEALKRYELMKGEIEKLKSEYQAVLQKVNRLESSSTKTSNLVENYYVTNDSSSQNVKNLRVNKAETQQNKTKKKPKTDEDERILPEITAFMSESVVIQDENHSNRIKEKEIGYDVENMDFGDRARLLEELLTKEFSDEELIEIGFTQSEIDIARAIQNASRDMKS